MGIWYDVYLTRSSTYFRLTQCYAGQRELHEGMCVTFDMHQIQDFKKEHPELSNMNVNCVIISVIRCDDRGAVFLKEMGEVYQVY